jgi:hypothetical protein
VPSPRSTGSPGFDAQTDFMRSRRRAAIARMVSRLRGEPDDIGMVLPYEEVVAALGFVSERQLGLQVVALDSIVGSVDRGRDFDRRFRPTSGRVRGRWEQIAAIARRGDPLPPIDLLRIGELHFVRDGHHRVSVSRALGREDIDAYVTEVQTQVGAEKTITLADLPMKSHQRLFSERIPLPDEARAKIVIENPEWYSLLAEEIEAWGFRAMQARGELLDRSQVAQLWLETEYLPVIEMLREADLLGERSETEAYMRVAAERYRLLRTHRWDEEVLQRVIEGRSRSRRR